MKNIDKADKDLFWMKEALALAKKSLDNGEVPIGAVIVKNHKLITHNDYYLKMIYLPL